MTPQLTPAQRQALADAIYAGKKIEAIKQIRTVTGLDLKDAKDMAEKLEAELRTEHPERFSSPAAKRGCTSMLLIVVAVGVVAFLLLRA